MAYELIYTSVPQGIKAGSSGFCTVAYTQGLAANIALKLEGMSAYKPYFPHYDANANYNPVSYSHHTAFISGETLHFISRVCFYGLDYTKRSNKLAHHCVLRSNEIMSLAAGPAAVCELKDFFITEWNSPPQLFSHPKEVPCPVNKFERAATWEAYSGDAGWAGKLAQHYLDTSGNKPAYIIFDPLKYSNILHLAYESLMLLPESKRWDVAFNTYFMSLPAGMNCHWRFCTPDAEILKDAKRIPGNLIIDLTAPLPPAGDGKLENAARTGQPVYNVPVVKSTTSRVTPASKTNAKQPENRAMHGLNSYKTPGTAVPFPTKSSRNILHSVLLGICLLVVAVIIIAVCVLFKTQCVPEDIPEKKEHDEAPVAPKLENKNKLTSKEDVEHTKKGQSTSQKSRSDDDDRLGSRSADDEMKVGKEDKSNKSNSASRAVDKSSSKTEISKNTKGKSNADKHKKNALKVSKIDRERRSLFFRKLEIDRNLGTKNGCIDLPNILEADEKFSKLKIKYTRIGKGNIPENKIDSFEVKNDQINGPQEMSTITFEDIKLFAFAVKYEKDVVWLRENNKDFNSKSAPQIIELETTKGGKISLLFAPDKSIWPKDKKDGLVKIKLLKEQFKICLSYRPTELDKAVGLEKHIRRSNIIWKTNQGKDLIFKNDGNKYSWSYAAPNAKELLRKANELKAFEEFFRKLSETEKEKFEACMKDLKNSPENQEIKGPIYCFKLLKDIKDKLEKEEKLKNTPEVKEFLKKELFKENLTLNELNKDNNIKINKLKSDLENYVKKPKEIRMEHPKKILKYVRTEEM